MTANPVKQRLAQGERAFGTMVFEFFSPGMPQIAKVAGAEFVLFDMEHTALDLDTTSSGRSPTAAASACRRTCGSRRTDYHFIAHALDAGAMGIMVPMVETARAGGVHRVVHALSARGPARRGLRLRPRRLQGRRRVAEDRRGAMRARWSWR